MIWNPEKECMSREQLHELQSERLVKIVRHTYDNVPMYRERMNAAGLTPDDIKSIEDISKLPFTTKKDLRDYYPDSLFAVPRSEIVRFHASSGTTGKPIVAGYTAHDVENWSEGTARCLTAYGAGRGDTIQVSYGYGLFTGGLGAHDGATRIGAAVLPTSAGNTSKQLMLMQDLGCTGLCCTPSYALFLAEELEKEGLRDKIQLKFGAFGAEPWTENMRKELESKLGIKAYDIYGLTEISGPGVGGECQCQDGTHLWEDMFYPEIIDPATGEPLPEGKEGELVFTTLDKWGMPMIRYRTRDLTHLNYSQCACGRTMVRMGRILGRSDDMLIVRGVNVFPSQVESILLEIPEFQGQYFITIDRVNNVDTFDIDVELREEFYTDEIAQLHRLRDRLVGRIVSVIGIKPNIHIVEPGSITRSMGKAKHVEDKRKFK
ncbi:MAG: phenylacetate--CoA ligase [Bacteroidales bacterium]|nr:phenylacetate--CoA ligase [Bacteroidales bacterium]